jgi:hypothetical protein
MQELLPHHPRVDPVFWLESFNAIIPVWETVLPGNPFKALDQMPEIEQNL